MTSVCLYFKVHQAYRLKQYEAEHVDVSHCYEDEPADEAAINMMADNCYLQANAMMYELVKKHHGGFKINYSISGTALELFQRYRPDVIESFKRLVKTDCVEILAETYYHSLSSLYSPKEFQRQTEKHSLLVKELFNATPQVFRNTELIYNNRIARSVAGLGFKGVLCEGVDSVLRGREPNKVYAAPDNGEFGLLLRNAGLSDDIAFRFDDVNWAEHPLTADKFAEWLHTHPENTEVINLFMDYETFGIHKKEGSGIFEFLQALPAAVIRKNGFTFSTASDALVAHYPKNVYDAPQTISWEDKSVAGCVWCENVMQHNMLKKIYNLESMVLHSGDKTDIDMWGRLQAADYFFYMAGDGSGVNTYKYQSPFGTPEEAFQNFTNIVLDFEIALIKKGIAYSKKYSSIRSMAYSLF